MQDIFWDLVSFFFLCGKGSQLHIKYLTALVHLEDHLALGSELEFIALVIQCHLNLNITLGPVERERAAVEKFI